MKAPSINPVNKPADRTTLIQLSSQLKRSRSAAHITRSRWLAYTVASSAIILTTAHSAQADIHYSGILDERFPQDASISKTFQLDPGHHIWLRHYGQISGGFDDFLIFGSGHSAGFIGYVRSDTFFVSKEAFGRNLSTAQFVNESSYFALLARLGAGQWTEPDKGFIGFKFNSGAGPQYGWARLKMGGEDKKNRFKLIDYAYADPGEPIYTGQRSNLQEPSLGSLGYLATGAVGLIAWRNRRRYGGVS